VLYFNSFKFTIFLGILLSGARLSPLGTAATTGLLYEPQMIDDDDCGAIGGIKIGKGSRIPRKKPTLAPLCPPQNPDPGSNPGRRGGKPVTNRLSYGAACFLVTLQTELLLSQVPHLCQGHMRNISRHWTILIISVLSSRGCNLVVVHRRYGGTYSMNFQGPRASKARRKQAVSNVKSI
jgi:hypothetical protein